MVQLLQNFLRFLDHLTAVEGIVNDFKSGKKKQEDFWIQMGEKLILIRYFAVHSEEGEYLGVLEVTQDIAPLKAITGEKRLVDKA